METALFNDLVQSLKEAGAISKGKAKSSQKLLLEAPDAKVVRETTDLSQSDFARLMQVSVKTFQDWEQHRRNPTGPAAALLKIVGNEPAVTLRDLQS